MIRLEKLVAFPRRISRRFRFLKLSVDGGNCNGRTWRSLFFLILAFATFLFYFAVKSTRRKLAVVCDVNQFTRIVFFTLIHVNRGGKVEFRGDLV